MGARGLAYAITACNADQSPGQLNVATSCSVCQAHHTHDLISSAGKRQDLGSTVLPHTRLEGLRHSSRATANTEKWQEQNGGDGAPSHCSLSGTTEPCFADSLGHSITPALPQRPGQGEGGGWKEGFQNESACCCDLSTGPMHNQPPSTHVLLIITLLQ